MIHSSSSSKSLQPWLTESNEPVIFKTVNCRDEIMAARLYWCEVLRRRWIDFDGQNMKSWPNAYDELAECLKFPGYFGRNLNALFDLLTDTHIVGEEGIVLCIRNESMLLSREEPSAREALHETFLRAARAMGLPIPDDQPDARPPIPFKLIAF